MRLSNAVGEYFCERYKLDGEQECDIEYVDPHTLLVPNRLDLVAKIVWIESYVTGKNRDFGYALYKEHIPAMTNGRCVEGGQEDEKNSVEKYIEAFKKLVDSISKDGFDEKISAVPVGENNSIMDGAHRTAIAIYFNMKLPIVRVSGLEAFNNAAFLIDRSLSITSAEYLVTMFCKKVQNVYAICIWPRGDKFALRKKAETMIDELCEIIYKKELNLNQQSLRNLMIQIYHEHEWMGSAAAHFSGASNKSEACWKKGCSTIVYFVTGPELIKMLELKEKIRGIFNIGNHSVHITDNQAETVQIANILLNENSVDLINNGKPDKYVQLNIIIEQFKKVVHDSGKLIEDYIVDASSVMGLYGLRECNDLDYLSKDDDVLENTLDGIDEHNAYLKYHGVALDTLLYDPCYHLYYNSVKFISLKQARAFKQNRAEKKDMDDVKLIESYFSNRYDIRDTIFKIRYFIRRLVKRTDNKIHEIVRNNPSVHSALRKVKYLIKGNKNEK